jgi:hypothetical protein
MVISQFLLELRLSTSNGLGEEKPNEEASAPVLMKTAVGFHLQI